MAGTVLALFKPARSEARAALHEAVSAHAVAEQALIDAKAGVGRGMRQADLAEERLASAVAATAEAKASLASAMSAPATSSATSRARDAAVRTARAEEVAAADTLEAAEAALAELQRQAIAAAEKLDAAKISVSNAAKVVIKDEAKSRTIARAQAIRESLDAKTMELRDALNRELAVLRFFMGKDCEEWNPGNLNTTDEDRVMWNLVSREQKIFDMSVQGPVRELWAAALDELHSNPDAQLPL